MEAFIQFCADNYYAMLWLVLMIVLIVVEVNTTQLVSIWFALGALVAAIVAGMGTSGGWQFAVFVAVSGLSLFFTRKFTRGVLHIRRTPTNADSVIGMSGSVIEEIDNSHESGRVYVNGLDWSARANDNSVLHIGDTVVVESIQGVKLMVIPKL